MTFSMPTAEELLGSRQRVLVTGGGGFIGGALVRRLLRKSKATVFNLDKMGYASDLTSIKEVLGELGDGAEQRHVLQKIDLANAAAVQQAVEQANPDLVMHLAAESHVDRSIDGPAAFIETNIVGTYTMLEAARNYWTAAPEDVKKRFRFHHISTDEVFGSLGDDGLFTEETAYDPRSPYSASKASSDHLVRAWMETYGLPTVLSNCSNNYGPYHFPEKLIPLMIIKGLAGEPLPVYGKGENVRDWLFVDDHARALWTVCSKGVPGESYNIGGNEERHACEFNEVRHGDQHLDLWAGRRRHPLLRGSRLAPPQFWNDDWTPKELLQGDFNIYRQIAIAIKSGPWRNPGLIQVATKLAKGGVPRAPPEAADGEPPQQTPLASLSLSDTLSARISPRSSWVLTGLSEPVSAICSVVLKNVPFDSLPGRRTLMRSKRNSSTGEMGSQSTRSPRTRSSLCSRTSGRQAAYSVRL